MIKDNYKLFLHQSGKVWLILLKEKKTNQTKRYFLTSSNWQLAAFIIFNVV